MDRLEASVCVVLPTVLAALFPGCPREVALEAASVAEAIAALDLRIPGIRDRICDSRPAIRRHIHIYVDGIRADLATKLTPGADILVMTAISGG
jgi:predicted phage tail protein